MTRSLLVFIYGISRWHIADRYNKPYVLDIIDYVNLQKVNIVVEIGCGFCDIISNLRARKKHGLDSSINVLKAANIYNLLRFKDINFRHFDFLNEKLPRFEADVWVLVNWIHEVEGHKLAKKLRRIFDSLNNGGMIIMDTVDSFEYKYKHNINEIFKDKCFESKIISNNEKDCRKVYSIVKLYTS